MIALIKGDFLLIEWIGFLFELSIPQRIKCNIELAVIPRDERFGIRGGR